MPKPSALGHHKARAQWAADEYWPSALGSLAGAQDPMVDGLELPAPPHKLHHKSGTEPNADGVAGWAWQPKDKQRDQQTALPQWDTDVFQGVAEGCKCRLTTNGICGPSCRCYRAERPCGSWCQCLGGTKCLNCHSSHNSVTPAASPSARSAQSARSASSRQPAAAADDIDADDDDATALAANASGHRVGGDGSAANDGGDESGGASGSSSDDDDGSTSNEEESSANESGSAVEPDDDQDELEGEGDATMDEPVADGPDEAEEDAADASARREADEDDAVRDEEDLDAPVVYTSRAGRGTKRPAKYG